MELDTSSVPGSAFHVVTDRRLLRFGARAMAAPAMVKITTIHQNRRRASSRSRAVHSGPTLSTWRGPAGPCRILHGRSCGKVARAPDGFSAVAGEPPATLPMITLPDCEPAFAAARLQIDIGRSGYVTAWRWSYRSLITVYRRQIRGREGPARLTGSRDPSFL